MLHPAGRAARRSAGLGAGNEPSSRRGRPSRAVGPRPLPAAAGSRPAFVRPVARASPALVHPPWVRPPVPVEARRRRRRAAPPHASLGGPPNRREEPTTVHAD